jgi:hypothetical protein
MEAANIQLNNNMLALDQLKFELTVASTREECRRALRRFMATDAALSLSRKGRRHVRRIASRYKHRVPAE